LLAHRDCLATSAGVKDGGPDTAGADLPPAAASRSARTRSPLHDLGYRLAIRSLDLTVSLLALTLFAPLMLVIAFLVKRDSPGPALFRQERRGKRPRNGSARDQDEEQFGRPFILYKFRTMFANARETFPDLYAYEHTADELRTLPIKVLVSRKRHPREIAAHPELSSGLVDDPRVTSIGRWLRRTSLDELPNFISVFKGDMSLVGPRPDIAENIRYYSPEHLHKLDVKPGITGLAQIRGRGTLSFLEINDYDVAYVQRRSLWLDLSILVRTIPAVLKRDGAF
jgi:lipopolysaccharide/colanic/teichoic acid biosynthesis glycosyltransferase